MHRLVIVLRLWILLSAVPSSRGFNGESRREILSANRRRQGMGSDHDVNTTDSIYLAKINKTVSDNDTSYEQILSAVKQLNVEIIGNRKMRNGNRALLVRTSSDVAAEMRDIGGISRVHPLREKRRRKKRVNRRPEEFLVLINATRFREARPGRGGDGRRRGRVDDEGGEEDDTEGEIRMRRVKRWLKRRKIKMVRQYHVGDLYALLIKGNERRVEKIIAALAARNLTVESLGEVDGDMEEVVPNFVLELGPQAAQQADRGKGGTGGHGGTAIVGDATESEAEHCKTQASESDLWGLTRIARTKVPGYQYSGWNYEYSANGTGVDVYVLDTGVYTEHAEFEGRARHGFTAPSLGDDEGPSDIHGHGTHVAGSVAGARTGVAKGANIIAVKVMDGEGSGPISALLEGIEYVSQQTSRRGGRPSVINLSLGGEGDYPILLHALKALIRTGVPAVVAAGNEGADACFSSPGQLEEAITVGASDDYDVMSSFSNTGPCVDIVAPGSGILSASIMGVDTLEIMSGTSMATPYVTGAVSVYMSALNDVPTPKEVRCWLLAKASANQLVVFFETPNRMLHCPCLRSHSADTTQNAIFQLSDDERDTCTYQDPPLAGEAIVMDAEHVGALNAANNMDLVTKTMVGAYFMITAFMHLN